MTLLSRRESRPGAAHGLDTARRVPTIWGLTIDQVHDRFWAAFGVQVVRPGQTAAIAAAAELYLLCESQQLMLLPLLPVLDTFSWMAVDLVLVRVERSRPRGYREVVVTDAEDGTVRVVRVYGEADRAMQRVLVTTSPELARRWAGADSPRAAWRQLGRAVPRERRAPVDVRGQIYDASDDREAMRFLADVVWIWPEPGVTIPRADRHTPGVWIDSNATAGAEAQFVGPVWIGAGRTTSDGVCVVGPAVLWDDPAARPPSSELDWSKIGLSKLPAPLRGRGRYRLNPVPGKRAFDILFALAVLLVTLPLLPIVALAILVEDGWPVFFAHRRETLGSREFPCLKFRSMRKDAETITAELQAQNLADGPQFFVDPDDDPRLTRVGRFIRTWQIDELPQFLNVLAGHMSIVGPRPSPYRENQYCPAWREARLSMRPGLTGLWQVMRTRAPGEDFQEWIKFDLEYAERRRWGLDLWIVWKTILLLTPWEQMRFWKSVRKKDRAAQA